MVLFIAAQADKDRARRLRSEVLCGKWFSILEEDPLSDSVDKCLLNAYCVSCPVQTTEDPKMTKTRFSPLRS